MASAIKEYAIPATAQERVYHRIRKMVISGEFREGDRIASSADGSKLIGVAKLSGITNAAVFTSTDFGATWSQRTVPPGKLASSADGTHLVVVDDTGTPYTSSGPTR